MNQKQRCSNGPGNLGRSHRESPEMMSWHHCVHSSASTCGFLILYFLVAFASSAVAGGPDTSGTIFLGSFSGLGGGIGEVLCNGLFCADDGLWVSPNAIDSLASKMSLKNQAGCHYLFSLWNRPGDDRWGFPDCFTRASIQIQPNPVAWMNVIPLENGFEQVSAESSNQKGLLNSVSIFTHYVNPCRRSLPYYPSCCFCNFPHLP